MFQLIHSKKEGRMSSDAAADIMNKFQVLSSQYAESHTSVSEDEILSQVIGPERHGRVRGYGLGPTPTLVFGPSSSRSELIKMLQSSNKSNETLRCEMEDLRKEHEDERKRNEEKVVKIETQFEEEREKNDRRFEELLALFNSFQAM